MKLLIAEDDAFFRRLLRQILEREYEITVAEDGARALDVLQGEDGPRLALIDWVMPFMTGPQVCRKIREAELPGRYLMILTAKNSPADILSGLRAGADDYVTKPFDPEELRARVRVGKRVVELQGELQARVELLRQSQEREREMSRLLPICPRCHRVRADASYWLDVERYVEQHVLGAAPGCTCTIDTESPRTELVPDEVAH
jgi:DNA-binding response OmpR family regulator